MPEVRCYVKIQRMHGNCKTVQAPHFSRCIAWVEVCTISFTWCNSLKLLLSIDLFPSRKLLLWKKTDIIQDSTMWINNFVIFRVDAVKVDIETETTSKHPPLSLFYEQRIKCMSVSVWWNQLNTWLWVTIVYELIFAIKMIEKSSECYDVVLIPEILFGFPSLRSLFAIRVWFSMKLSPLQEPCFVVAFNFSPWFSFSVYLRK